MAKKYRLRVEVRHDGVKLEAGSICPPDLVAALDKQGLLEVVGGVHKNVPGNVEPKGESVTLVGDDEAETEEESEDLDSDESEADVDESEESEGDEGGATKATPAASKKVPAKRAAPRKAS